MEIINKNRKIIYLQAENQKLKFQIEEMADSAFASFVPDDVRIIISDIIKNVNKADSRSRRYHSITAN